MRQKPMLIRAIVVNEDGTIVGTKTVNADDIDLAERTPLRPLTEEESARVDTLFARLGADLIGRPLEKFKYTLSGDEDPNVDLTLWETSADAYDRYLKDYGHAPADERLRAWRVILMTAGGVVDVPAVMRVPDWFVALVRGYMRPKE